MKLGQKIAIGYIRTKLQMLSVVSTRKAAEKAFEIFCTPRLQSKKQFAPVFEKAEKLTTKVEQVTIHGFRWNKGGSKRVLLLHGFESSCKNFDRYIIALVKKGYEVLAFDAPAHGRSGGKQITLPMYVAAIKTICTRYGPVDSYMAHSFGGLAVTHFLETTAHTNATHVALIAPATETVTALDMFFRFLRLNDEVRTAFDTIIQERGGVHPAHYSIPRALQQIQARILWVQDEEDDVTPFKDVQPVIDKHYPNIRFVVTKGLGHSKIYRDNEVIKKVTDFL